MSSLITGGTGYVGAELAHLLVERGEPAVLFDVNINRHRVADIEREVKIVQGDLGNSADILNAVRDNAVTEIYHLGSMLAFASEDDPQASFRANVVGTCNLLEAARLCNVKQVMFTSTIGTFGLEMPEVCTDLSLQRPLTMYGCGKLYVEGLGRFYRRKFGLDFRAIRYALMVGPGVRTPGHWAPRMIEDVIQGRPHAAIYATPESAISPIYVRDAARAAMLVLDAPAESIKMVNYNVAGIPQVVTAAAFEAALKKRYSGAAISYEQDLTVAGVQVHNAMRVFDDGHARKEWGWQPLYDTPEAIIEAFEQDMKAQPQRYGLA